MLTVVAVNAVDDDETKHSTRPESVVIRGATCTTSGFHPRPCWIVAEPYWLVVMVAVPAATIGTCGGGGAGGSQSGATPAAVRCHRRPAPSTARDPTGSDCNACSARITAAVPCVTRRSSEMTSDPSEGTCTSARGWSARTPGWLRVSGSTRSVPPCTTNRVVVLVVQSRRRTIRSWRAPDGGRVRVTLSPPVVSDTPHPYAVPAATLTVSPPARVTSRSLSPATPGSGEPKRAARPPHTDSPTEPS